MNLELTIVALPESEQNLTEKESCILCERYVGKAVKQVVVEIDDGACTTEPSKCPCFREGDCDGEHGVECEGWFFHYPICVDCAEVTVDDGYFYRAALRELSEGGAMVR